MNEKLSVITAHGIGTDGAWQETIRRVLEPHFTCINLKYSEYRNLGWLKICLGKATLFVFLGAISAYLIIGVFVGHWHNEGVVLSALLLPVAYFEAMLRRKAAARRFKRDLDAATSGCMERPHAIAHSFGTFLLGEALLRFDEVKFDCIVLAGCVLPSAFNWEAMYKRKGSFRQIRNEVGRKDWVALAAGLVRLPTWGLGNAGWRGFRYSWWRELLEWRNNRSRVLRPLADSVSPFIHTMDGALEPCSHCYASGRSSAGVHNVRIGKRTHSDHFIGTGHARQFWLPFLWGIDPGEYRDFFETCIILCRYGKLHDRQISGIETIFVNRAWKWLGCSLDESMTRAIDARVRGLEGEKRTALIIEGLRLVCQLVYAAEHSYNQIDEGDRDFVVLALNPHIALSRAIDTSVLRAAEV